LSNETWKRLEKRYQRLKLGYYFKMNCQIDSRVKLRIRILIIFSPRSGSPFKKRGYESQLICSQDHCQNAEVVEQVRSNHSNSLLKYLLQSPTPAANRL
jgi:hypothetical protein